MKKRLIILLTFFLNFNIFVIAQSCGPNCPVCSGTIDGNLADAKTISLQAMYIPNGEEETGLMSLRYSAFDWLNLGISYAFKTQKIIWNARLLAIKQNEDNWKPSLILGTGSIRSGGNDQSIYMSILKSHEFSEEFAMSLSGGIASLTSDMDRLYGIANLSLTFSETISTYVNFDGISFHEGVSWTMNDTFTLSFMLVESKDPAITLSFTKSLL